MTRILTEIDAILGQVERLARQLPTDPDRFIERSATDLRSTFDDRRAIEPAVDRVRISVQVLRRAVSNQHAASLRPATTLDFLDDVIEHELMPRLRCSGFDV
jgi:hypothetical protein